jgi:ammonium transporter Rh
MKQELVFSRCMVAAQVIFIAFFVSSTTYKTDTFTMSQYGMFRDIMAMLLLGFGYLMTFIKTYGLGAIGFTMILTAVSMQLNVMVEYAMRAMNGGETFPMQLTMNNLIDAEFAAATLLISFGAVIGRASPLQMLALTVSQSVFYAFNKVILVFGYIQAEDVGGTLTIHMFGAYFGMAASYALGATDDEAKQDKISDIFAFIGTTVSTRATQQIHIHASIQLISHLFFLINRFYGFTGRVLSEPP